MNSITVCTVVRNEQMCLPAFIHHVHDIGMQLCIVDQHSDDRSREVIASLLHDTPFCKDYLMMDSPHGYCEPSRAMAEQNATGDWILVLGVHDRVTKYLMSDIQALMESGQDGFRLRRKSIVDTWEIGQYRFFRKGLATYLDELHTEPQPRSALVKNLPYIALEKHIELEEIKAAELRYLRIIDESDKPEAWKAARRALNRVAPTL